MEPVKKFRIEFNAKFVGNGRDVQQRIGRTGNGRVNHYRIFKGLFGDDVPGFQSLLCQLHHLLACLPGNAAQILTGSGHQGRTGEHQAQGFAHDLHGGGGTHKGAGTAGGTGMVLVPGELIFGDLTTVALGGINADLFQSQ